MKTPTCKDFVGQELKVGDIITYPGRSGSSLWMSLARIREIVYHGNDKWNPKTRKCDAPRFSLKIVGVSSNYDDTLMSNYKAELACVDRVVRIPDDCKAEKVVQLRSLPLDGG